MEFIGRQTELQRLESLKNKGGASMVVITGRRRIGKTRLADEFGRQFPNFLKFSGIPPHPGTTAQQQRNEFIRQLREQTGLPQVTSEDWGDLFKLLARETRAGRVLILLDEISWMSHKDDLFLGKLKIAWDHYFSQNPKLILLLCGSVSSWIEDNILSSTGFVGRISLHLIVRELRLPYCNRFWGERRDTISAYEKFKVLAVTGGIPRYLEEIQSGETAEQNITRLCFTEGALLFDEFNRIFSDLFNKQAKTYKKILHALSKGMNTYQQLAKNLKRTPGGTLSKQLEILISAGFVQKKSAWSLREGTPLKTAAYRLSDNYSRFYLKYIDSNRERIAQGQYPDRQLSYLPAWETVMGLQFENLVLNNLPSVIAALGLAPPDIVNEGPYLQTGTKKRSGTQIDLLIQDRYGTFFVCEIKFTRTEIGPEVIKAVSEKIARLDTPPNTSKRPVLIHCGAVAEGVSESRFFSRIISFDRFLNG